MGRTGVYLPVILVPTCIPVASNQSSMPSSSSAFVVALDASLVAESLYSLHMAVVEVRSPSKDGLGSIRLNYHGYDPISNSGTLHSQLWEAVVEKVHAVYLPTKPLSFAQSFYWASCTILLQSNSIYLHLNLLTRISPCMSTRDTAHGRWHVLQMDL